MTKRPHGTGMANCSHGTGMARCKRRTRMLKHPHGPGMTTLNSGIKDLFISQKIERDISCRLSPEK